MAGSRPDLLLPDAPTGSSCVHHWILGDPAGGFVPGRCRHCAASKAFPASPGATERFDDYRELTASSSYYQRTDRSA